MKYFYIHHGIVHTFDTFEVGEKNDDWIYYECDGCRHGGSRSLLSETFQGACEKYAAHCLERIQSNAAGVKTALNRAAEQIDNITVWSNGLVRFMQTILPKS